MLASSPTLLRRQRSNHGVLHCGWLALDVDTYAMDNGSTAQEVMCRTYAGVDGHCPLVAYLGSHGFCLELALRPGLPQVGWLIKCNPRSTDAAAAAAALAARLDADTATLWGHPHAGKRVMSWDQAVTNRVCQLAELAMNILRQLGQRGPLEPDAPVRRSARRRRMKTAMQELIYRAARLIEHGRRVILGPGANDRAATVLTHLHAQFALSP